MKWLCMAAALGGLTQLGCGRADTDTGTEAEGVATGTQRQAVSPAALPELNTFINRMIEIDQLGLGLAPEDANLFVTGCAECIPTGSPTAGDPADGSPSAQKPTGGPPPFIDWDDLKDVTLGGLDNHRLLDLNAAGGRDPTSFPQANECVASSQVLAKMDLTYVAAANNNAWAYFAVQRSDNNGDAGYYWLFTRREPRLIVGQSPCSSSQSRLLYDISPGDVLLGGHFNPTGTPLLRVFTAEANPAPGSNGIWTGVTAVNAIDFTNHNIKLWAPHPAGVGAVAVNTTITRAGAFGAAGVNALKGTTGRDVDTEIFAESAVSVNVFTGGNNCEARFFGSVITRSSGAGGPSPDLKDLAGPAVFNFGSASASARVAPTCDLHVKYSLTKADSIGGPIANPLCQWTFSGPDGAKIEQAEAPCTVDQELEQLLSASGSWTATVNVRDPLSNCAATATTAPVQAFNQLTPAAKLTASCGLDFSYEASASDGEGPFGFSWTFTEGVTPHDSAVASGTATAIAGGPYGATLVVTDLGRVDDGLNCFDVLKPGVTVFPEAKVTPLLVGSCQGSLDYSASPEGGSGTFSYQWSFPPGVNPVLPSSATSQSGTATVPTGGVNYQATVEITDTGRTDRPDCKASAPAEAMVFKSTTATARLKPDCTLNVGFEVTAIGGAGTTISNPDCSWIFDDGQSSDACSGILPFLAAPGGKTHSGTVTVIDPAVVAAGFDPSAPGCSASAVDDATIYPVLEVKPDLNGTCEGTFSYAANPSGGTGNFTYQWKFSSVGGLATITADTAIASGIATVNIGNETYLGEVQVNDTRPPDDTHPEGLVCDAKAEDPTKVFLPTRATARLDASCSTEVDYQLAAATGGAGTPISNPSCLWTFDDG
ncbi:MAG TPA: hypothetical protein VE549_08305, partial [Myxococcaceae bacterium]|nr:hypothetical protein [Myxococcaceae bacterium]